MTLAKGDEDESNVVIGILSHRTLWEDYYNSSEYSYIASSYVKYIESSGARIVPIKYDLDHESILEILSKINGVLLPGGGTTIFNVSLLQSENKTQFSLEMNTAKFIIDYAIVQNDKGNIFPIFGICLGYEMMLLAISNDANILSNVENINRSLPIHYLNTSKDSRLFSQMTERMKIFINKEPIFHFNHKFAIPPDSFFGIISLIKESEEISKFYNPLAINEGECNRTFISIIEAKKYPFYGMQFHPEKGSFEWKDIININHSPGAIEADRYFAYYFIEEARKNKNVYPDTLEWNNKLIYNYYPIQISDVYISVYIFSKPNKEEEFFAKINIPPNNNLKKNSISKSQNGNKV